MKKLFTICAVLFLIVVVVSYGNDPYKGYRAYMDVALGDAYNLNTARTVSTNNMQLYSMFTTTHGYVINNWFVGGGIGYYHSFRDSENMFPIYASGRYTFDTVKMEPYIETRAGVIYDPCWVNKIQGYCSLATGVNIYKRLQAGLRLSLFTRPSRFFTANAAIVLSYAFGK